VLELGSPNAGSQSVVEGEEYQMRARLWCSSSELEEGKEDEMRGRLDRMEGFAEDQFSVTDAKDKG
jgi:hypothetical protein